MRKVNFFKFSISDHKYLVDKVCWPSLVKQRKGLYNILSRIAGVLVGRLGRSYSLALHSFCVTVYKLYKKQGPFGTVKYLKTCHLLLVKYLAGDPLNDTRLSGGRVSRTKRGMPRIIPSAHRTLITKGEKNIIRFWFSLFNLYRVIEVPQPVVSYETIVAPGKDIKVYLDRFSRFLHFFLRNLRKFPGIPRVLEEGPRWEWKYTPIAKVGPIAGAASFDTMVQQARHLQRSPIWEVFKSITILVGLAYEAIEDINLLAQGNLILFSKETFENFTGVTGRLALKVEPAGKVRVFAIVDYFTQTLLRPLHLWLFSILRVIPQDGTFNQTSPMERLIKEGHLTCFSYDLSAATDRLPLSLQELLLSSIISRSFGSLWARLLVDRDYRIPSKSTLDFLKVRLDPKFKGLDRVKYAVGQPMGALSSWAMLALTHHLCVQYCAWECGFKQVWFSQYAILGDDVVICHSGVASRYVSLMSNLGVSLNLAKSVVSLNSCTMEFAKKIIHQGVDVSGISLNEISAADSSLAALMELVRKVGLKDRSDGQVSSFAHLLRFKGKGWRSISRAAAPFHTMSKRAALLLSFLTCPWGLYPKLASVWLTSNGINNVKANFSNSQEEYLSIAMLFGKFVHPIYNHWNPFRVTLDKIIPKPGGKTKVEPSSLKKVAQGADMTLLKRLQNILHASHPHNEKVHYFNPGLKAIRDLELKFQTEKNLLYDTVFDSITQSLEKVDEIPSALVIAKRSTQEESKVGRWLKLWYEANTLFRGRYAKGYDKKVESLIAKYDEYDFNSSNYGPLFKERRSSSEYQLFSKWARPALLGSATLGDARVRNKDLAGSFRILHD